jgi:hypothetical protein
MFLGARSVKTRVSDVPGTNSRLLRWRDAANRRPSAPARRPYPTLVLQHVALSTNPHWVSLPGEDKLEITWSFLALRREEFPDATPASPDPWTSKGRAQ